MFLCARPSASTIHHGRGDHKFTWLQSVGVTSSSAPNVDQLVSVLGTIYGLQRPLLTNHHVNRAHDVIVERVATAVHVGENGLRHAIIHDDGGEGNSPLASILAFGVHTRL